MDIASTHGNLFDTRSFQRVDLHWSLCGLEHAALVRCDALIIRLQIRSDALKHALLRVELWLRWGSLALEGDSVARNNARRWVENLHLSVVVVGGSEHHRSRLDTTHLRRLEVRQHYHHAAIEVLGLVELPQARDDCAWACGLAQVDLLHKQRVGIGVRLDGDDLADADVAPRDVGLVVSSGSGLLALWLLRLLRVLWCALSGRGLRLVARGLFLLLLRLLIVLPVLLLVLLLLCRFRLGLLLSGGLGSSCLLLGGLCSWRSGLCFLGLRCGFLLLLRRSASFLRLALRLLLLLLMTTGA